MRLFYWIGYFATLALEKFLALFLKPEDRVACRCYPDRESLTADELCDYCKPAPHVEEDPTPWELIGLALFGIAAFLVTFSAFLHWKL